MVKQGTEKYFRVVDGTIYGFQGRNGMASGVIVHRVWVARAVAV